MKRFSTKFLAAFLAAIMLLGMMPASVFAAGEKMTISVSAVSGLPGDTVTVKIDIKDNPGVSSIQLDVAFDESVLSLKSVEYNTAMGGQSLPPQKMKNPATLTWVSPFQNYNGDATFATLTFVISADAEEDTVSPITVTYDPNNIYNMDEDNIPCDVVDGSVKVLSCVPGDINGDQLVNNKDVTRMFQYIAKWDVEVNEPALDTNGDGYVNNKDLTRLFQYIAKWDVELHCGSATTTKCNHELVAFPALSATCTENGHVAYWQCALCNKYFTSEAAVTETTVDKLLVEATGHTAVIDPAVEPTYTSVGYTEGSHCSVCNEVLIAREEIPMLKKQEYAITYNIAGNDTYLAGVEIANPNPAVYTTEDGLALKNLTVPGYTFEGWYDAPGASGEIVKSIPANSKGDVELYARWSVVEYTVMFESDLIPVDETSYTVNRDTVLPTPTLDGYIFAGWSNDDGEIIKKIPKGTVGHQTYMANWLSERNQAWTKTQLDEPIIYEDDNVILFTYEIGEIRNVPLYVIHDFGKINSNGVEKTVTKTYSTTVSESQMEMYTDTVSKATTDSFGWVLSSGWSDSVTVSEEWCKENGITKEEAQTICTNDSDNWYVSNGSSGSATSYKLDTSDNYDFCTTTYNNREYDDNQVGAKTEMNAGVDVKLSSGFSKGKKNTQSSEGSSNEDSNGVNFGIEGGPSLGIAAGNYTERNKGYDRTTITDSGDGNYDHHEESLTDSSSWNSSSGYGGSSSVSKSTTVSTAISEKISQKYGYGEQYISTGGESQSQGYTSSEASSNSYSSSVVYSTAKTEEITATYTTSNTMSGYHRWIMAGTAHVFAVVGYDIASKSYFVYNFSVMDDEMHEFEDYSYSYSSYNDNENGVIGFEIPTDITTYVSDRTSESEGLEVSKDGIVTGFSGDSTFVVIPEYKVINNLDGTNSVIKITGISANAFAGNENIEFILFSDFITEIPAGAFKNCTSLEGIYAANISTIGDDAISGCISMKNAIVGDILTTLGENVFSGIENLIVDAANANVVKAAISSGATNISITITEKCTDLHNINLSVSDKTEWFIFNGYGKEYTNVYIESDAAKTAIHRAIFVSSSKAPLKITSPEIVLQEVTATAPTIAMMIFADNASIALYGESYIESAGENAMLSKNITITKLKDDFYSQLNVDGNLLICGDSEDGGYLTIENGSIVKIDEDTFNKYASGTLKVSFDANGGTVDAYEKTVFYGDLYGELPVPTKDNYSFAGWYTAASDGNEILSGTVVTEFGEQTLYAHWAANVFTVTFDANGGTVSTDSKSVTFGDAYGELPVPTKTGFTFDGWINADFQKVTEDTVQSNDDDITITAAWKPNSYTVSWNTGTGYTITVSRTSSKYANASTGALSNGATVYYGDELSVSYSAVTNYEIKTNGATSVTVTGNVTSGTIYATAALKANYVTTVSGTTGSNYGKDVRYYMEVYTVGHQLLIKGWLYDANSPASSLDIDIGSVFRETTNIKTTSCPCGGCAKGYNRYHGFEFYQGNYSGNVRIMMHTWSASGGDPLGLWDSFNDVIWVKFPE